MAAGFCVKSINEAVFAMGDDLGTPLQKGGYFPLTITRAPAAAATAAVTTAAKY
jgi:hypothetical protein